ncbi:hypothetical protein PGQ11_014932 [Apiospora arundinis]|uniref:Uncharacterized protein n=1 Tax=Apiospora arundinis TaxID=335852 RepID=A0ABR2HJS6_9PEZI
MARYPAIYRAANPAHSPGLQDSHKAKDTRRDEPITNTEAKFVDVLKNVQKRNRARKCEGLDVEKTFLGRMHKFLSYWETDDYAGRNKTEHDLLIRIVEYQAVYQTMVDQSLQDAFPDDIVDQIRSVHKLATEDGALVGGNPRILDPLDIILDDVCAETGNAKVPRRVQEIVNVILNGDAFNAIRGNPDSPPTDCECGGNHDSYPCGVALKHYWDKPNSAWRCDCYSVQC